MVSRFALVLAERAHLVLVLSAPGGLEVCIGHWGRSQAHELAQGLREGPQPVLHAGQDAVVAWRTRTGRVSRRGRGRRDSESQASCLDLSQEPEDLPHIIPDTSTYH